MDESGFDIRVVVKPVRVPDPAGFDIFRKSDGQWVASLTAEQVRDALSRFDSQKRRHDEWASKKAPDPKTEG